MERRPVFFCLQRIETDATHEQEKSRLVADLMRLVIQHFNPPALRVAGAVFVYILHDALKCLDLIANPSDDHDSLLFGHGALTPNQVSDVAQIEFAHQSRIAYERTKGARICRQWISGKQIFDFSNSKIDHRLGNNTGRQGVIIGESANIIVIPSCKSGGTQ